MEVLDLCYGLRTARDLFGKLVRDAALLDDQVTGDRMFNFVVTAMHLAEWIEKDPTMSVAPTELAELRVSPLLAACREIADALKHFDLEPRRASTTDVVSVSTSQGYSVGRFGKGGFGADKEQITITLDSSGQVGALRFVRDILGLNRPLFAHAAQQGVGPQTGGPMRRIIAAVIASWILVLLPIGSAHAEKVGVFLDVINGADATAKSQYLSYFAGVQDTLMYMNDWLVQTGRVRPICFPDPIPSREQFLKEFIEHVALASKTLGAAKVRSGHVDQLMLAGWLRRYPCPK